MVKFSLYLNRHVFVMMLLRVSIHYHTGQSKSTGGGCNAAESAFQRTGVGEKWRKRKTKDIEDIQMFGVNMTFISSSEVKKCIFHECRRHE